MPDSFFQNKLEYKIRNDFQTDRWKEEQKGEGTMHCENPVLRGFHPDPSMIRVDDDYYLAVSTFEWFPGVRIYHSKNLMQWEYLTAPLDDAQKADLEGCSASDGIWAPHLSYDGSQFYLIYTVVHGARENPVMEVSNYLITAPTITGNWSKPVYLNSSGFDPSIFHEEDGSKWIVNMEWNYRKACCGEAPFTGILLQQYDSEQKKLIGNPEKIFCGTAIGSIEGPQIFKRNGYYYLVCAEGGTGWFHAVTVARSRCLNGPYEVHPQNPVLSSWSGSMDQALVQQEKAYIGIENVALKKAGHGCFCESKDGIWYLSHLCARPIPGTEYCPMGRETAIQEIIWKEDWPYLKSGARIPENSFEGIGADSKSVQRKVVYSFHGEAFFRDFQTLRKPWKTLGMTLEEKKGCLRIYGRESIYSRFDQALIARRQSSLRFEAETTFTFAPDSFQHAAGLIYRYDEKNQYYAFVSYDEDEAVTTVNLLQVVAGKTTWMASHEIHADKYCIRIKVHENETNFSYLEHGAEKELGESLRTEVLSDEFADGFTGAFVGMTVSDLKSHSVYADFESFVYEEL